MMFDRNVRIMADEIGYDQIITAELKQFLQKQDLVVANLEGPITQNKSLSAGTKPGDQNNTRFTFDPIIASWLFNHNIKLVNLGNNHAYDFGVEGATSTQQFLNENNIQFFGTILAIF